MGHVVHLYFPPPWTGKSITLDDRQRHHLEVLRHQEGDRVTYTDGEGTFGQGLRIGNSVERGTEEFRILDRAGLVLAVAPPPERERQRFLVEKLAELGVDRLMWLRCRYGEGRPATRASEWAQTALEQSRGDRLMLVDSILTPAGDLVGWAADSSGVATRPAEVFSGGSSPPGSLTLLIGPAGGWAPTDLDPACRRFSMGERVLRTETAALVAAALVLQALRTARTSHPE